VWPGWRTRGAAALSESRPEAGWAVARRLPGRRAGSSQRLNAAPGAAGCPLDGARAVSNLRLALKLHQLELARLWSESSAPPLAAKPLPPGQARGHCRVLSDSRLKVTQRLSGSPRPPPGTFKFYQLGLELKLGTFKPLSDSETCDSRLSLRLADSETPSRIRRLLSESAIAHHPSPRHIITHWHHSESGTHSMIRTTHWQAHWHRDSGPPVAAPGPT
jgi:hypothetical protein